MLLLWWSGRADNAALQRVAQVAATVGAAVAVAVSVFDIARDLFG